MKLFSYTYSVIYYSHDPSAGEKLNIGVVAFSPEVPFLRVKFQHNYERLSSCFAHFNGENYKRAVHRFEIGVQKITEQLTTGLFATLDTPQNVNFVTSQIWPDKELSYTCGPILSGVSERLDDDFESIFDRFVTSQYEQSTSERRTDEEVWSVFRDSFLRASITPALEPKTFMVGSFEVKFEHSFKNGAWHALYPVSLDFSKPEGMRNKVTRLLGSTVLLEDTPELDTIYLLLGQPKSQENMSAYRKAKELLEKRMKVKHQIIEEDQAEGFAQRLAVYMKEHGVIKDQTLVGSV